MVPPKHVLFVGGISSAASLADIIREFHKFGKCNCSFKVRGRRPQSKGTNIQTCNRQYALALSLVVTMQRWDVVTAK